MLDLFKHPPNTYKLAPVWLWNHALDENEIERQIHEMHHKGIGGFYVVNQSDASTGLDQEQWKRFVKRASSVAQKLGMFAHFCQHTPPCLHDECDQVSRSTLNTRKHFHPSKEIIEIPTDNGAAQQAYIVPIDPTARNNERMAAGKLYTSAAHSSGIRRVFSLLHSGARCNHSLEQMKAFVDWGLTAGVNVFSPENFLYSAAGISTLESQFYQAPYWPYYKLLADYTARLCCALSHGRHKAQVAILNPVKSIEFESCAGKLGFSGNLAVQYFNLFCEHLPKEHIDYDILCEESVQNALAVDQSLIVQNEEYELLILPAMCAIGYQTAQKIAEFVEDGGRILATSLLPIWDSDGEQHQSVRDMFAGIFDIDPVGLMENAKRPTSSSAPRLNHNGSNILLYEAADPSELIPGLRGTICMAIKPEISIRHAGAECQEITYVHRVLDNKDIFFFSNNSPEPREVQISMRCDRAPYLLNPETGVSTALANCTQQGSRTLLFHRFERFGSALVYFSNELTLTPVHQVWDSGYEIVFSEQWDFRIEAPNCLSLQEWNIDNALHSLSDMHASSASFQADYLPEHLLLVIDAQVFSDPYMVIINGREVTSRNKAGFDVGFDLLDIAEFINPGTNGITIASSQRKAVAHIQHGNCKPRLMGSFSVDKSGTTIKELCQLISNGSWTNQGYPFYSGTGVYSQDIDIPEFFRNQRVFVRADNPADIVEFVVNGASAGTRAWAPFEVEVTNLIKPGTNRFEFKVTSSLSPFTLRNSSQSGLLGSTRIIIY